jgi:hypothetical protein
MLDVRAASVLGTETDHVREQLDAQHRYCRRENAMHSPGR